MVASFFGPSNLLKRVYPNGTNPIPVDFKYRGVLMVFRNGQLQCEDEDYEQIDNEISFVNYNVIDRVIIYYYL